MQRLGDLFFIFLCLCLTVFIAFGLNNTWRTNWDVKESTSSSTKEQATQSPPVIAKKQPDTSNIIPRAFQSRTHNKKRVIYNNLQKTCNVGQHSISKNAPNKPVST